MNFKVILVFLKQKRKFFFFSLFFNHPLTCKKSTQKSTVTFFFLFVCSDQKKERNFVVQRTLIRRPDFYLEISLFLFSKCLSCEGMVIRWSFTNTPPNASFSYRRLSIKIELMLFFRLELKPRSTDVIKSNERGRERQNERRMH